MHRSELQIRTKLDLPCAYAKWRSCGAKGGVLHSRVQTYPRRMVECIEKHALKLEADIRLDWNCLVEREVGIEVGRVM